MKCKMWLRNSEIGDNSASSSNRTFLWHIDPFNRRETPLCCSQNGSTCIDIQFAVVSFPCSWPHVRETGKVEEQCTRQCTRFKSYEVPMFWLQHACFCTHDRLLTEINNQLSLLAKLLQDVVLPNKGLPLRPSSWLQKELYTLVTAPSSFGRTWPTSTMRLVYHRLFVAIPPLFGYSSRLGTHPMAHLVLKKWVTLLEFAGLIDPSKRWAHIFTLQKRPFIAVKLNPL